MFRVCLFLVSVLSFISASYAADYYTPPPAPPPPVFTPAPPAQAAPNWSGCYIGMNTGVHVNNTKFTPDQGIASYTDSTGGTGGVDLGKFNSYQDIVKATPLLGGTIGCDANFGSLLVGVVAQGTLTIQETRSGLGGADPWSDVVTIQNPYNVDLSLRMGQIFDTTLVFGKIGLGLAPFTYDNVYQAAAVRYYADTVSNKGGYLPTWMIHLNASEASSHLRFAPVVGFGIEHMLDTHWSITSEVDVMYFPTQSYDMTITKSSVGIPNATATQTNYNVGDPWHYSAQTYLTNFKIGLNRRF